MAEPTQFKFSLREATIALIKQQGLHEGRWIFGVEFGLAVANFGPEPNAVLPTAFAAVQSLQLTQAAADAVDSSLIVDAAEVNPRPPDAPETKVEGRARVARRAGAKATG